MAVEPEVPSAVALVRDFVNTREPQVDAEVTSALWSAVHALEDTASAARWRQTQPGPPAYLVGQIRDAQREADLIREFIRQSAAAS